MNTLPSMLMKRDNLIREWRGLDGQLCEYKQGNPHRVLGYLLAHWNKRTC